MKFLNSTSTQQTLNNIGRIFKNALGRKKEVWAEIKQLMSRLPAFLATGAPKTLGDVQSYFVKYGDKRGLALLTKDIWLATHVGLPLSMAAVHTIYNLLLLTFTPVSGVPRETLWNDYITNLQDDFLQQYKWRDGSEPDFFSIAWGLLSPGHMIGRDIWNWIMDFTGRAERGDARIPQDLKDAFEKYNIPKNEQDIMINAIKNAQTAEEAERIVADSLKGISDISQFQKWVKKEWDTDYTGTEKFDKEGEYYTVNDGVIIYYYKKNSDGTFVEDRSKQKKI